MKKKSEKQIKLQKVFERDLLNGREFTTAMQRYAFSYLRDYHTSEDCTFSFIDKIIKRADLYYFEIDPEKNINEDFRLKNWLWASFKRSVVDFYRRQKNVQKTITFSDYLRNRGFKDYSEKPIMNFQNERYKDAKEILIDSETEFIINDVIYTGLERINPFEKNAILSKLCGLNNSEISETFKISIKEVKNRIRCGKKRLKKILKKDKRLKDILENLN